MKKIVPLLILIVTIISIEIPLCAETLVSQGFEQGLEEWSTLSNGNVPSSITTERSHSGNYSLKVGPSSCGVNCFDGYTVSVIREFDEPIFVSTITSWIYEEGNWGGKGYLIVDGVEVEGPNLNNAWNSDPVLDEWVEKKWEINKEVSSITFYFTDLTSSDPMYIDDIVIEGRTYAESINTYLILTENSVPLYLPKGSYVQAYGSNGTNTLNVEEYARLQCKNFIGENEINIEEASSQFTVYRSGATVYLNSTSGTRVEIPATETSQTLRFADGSLELVISDGAVILGSQVVDETEQSIDSDVNSSDTSESIF